MMRYKILTLIFLNIIFIAKLIGQAVDNNDAYKKLGIKFGYFGEFVMHPGFAGGIDYTIHQNNWLNVHWDSELGMYSHKWNNNALFIQSTIGGRFISSFSGFVDLNIGLGYMLTSPNGDVYMVDEDGNLSSNGRPYQSGLKPIISLMFGWDGTRKKDIPLIFHAGIEAYYQTHFNHSMLPHGAFRLGIVYRLKKN